MAERRMFAKTIIDSDDFLDMPVTARLLYYDLAMRADDDGFVNSPKKIMKFVGASPDDMSILIMRKFVIPFDSGVVVIRHWRIHNYIRKDTYSETPYKTEKATLSLDENNAYVKTDETALVNEPSTTRPRLVNEPTTQDRIGKDRIGKVREEDICVESSHEASTPQPDTDVIICALILNDRTLYHLTESMAEQYEKLYPAVDVRQEFRNMAGWCEANPMKRKTRGGVKRFITNWMARQQNSGRVSASQSKGGYIPQPDDYPF